MDSSTIEARQYVPFVMIPHEFINDERIRPFHLAVFCAIAKFANNKSEAWPSFTTIAKLAGVSRKKSITVVQELIDMGWIEKVRRWDEQKNRNQSNVYILNNVAQKKEGVVYSVHQGSVPDTPRMVYDVHQGSVQRTPELEPKELEPRELDIYRDNFSDSSTDSEPKAVPKPKPKKKRVPDLLLGSEQNVRLTTEEKKRLEQEFGSDITADAIEYLSMWKEEKGKRTKNDNLAIRRWVINAVVERRNKPVSHYVEESYEATQQKFREKINRWQAEIDEQNEREEQERLKRVAL